MDDLFFSFNESQRKWFAKNVDDYDVWVDFEVRMIIEQMIQETYTIVFHIIGKKKAVSLVYEDGIKTKWVEKSTIEPEELLKHALMSNIVPMNDRSFLITKKIIDGTIIDGTFLD